MWCVPSVQTLIFTSVAVSTGRGGAGACSVLASDVPKGGADPVTARPGFVAMLDRIAGNGVQTIIVESPDRFARDLAVQLAGHDYLKNLGVALIPASAPDFFLEDTPTAVLVRQVLGAIAQFEKATIVAKLKAARDRKREKAGKCEGRKSYAEANPQLVDLAKQLSDRRPRLSLRQILRVTEGLTTRENCNFPAKLSLQEFDGSLRLVSRSPSVYPHNLRTGPHRSPPTDCNEPR
jgi:DNA invertase Pin-like site-specific DNA recombinase